jgi:1,4-alpha-glucan branching enzyme
MSDQAGRNPPGKRGNMAKQMTTKQRVTFSFVGPKAQSVQLAADFTSWEKSAVQFEKDKSGVWRKTILLTPGRYEYRLLVDGQWRDDPQCATRQPNQFGGENCVCVVNGA